MNSASCLSYATAGRLFAPPQPMSTMEKVKVEITKLEPKLSKCQMRVFIRVDSP